MGSLRDIVTRKTFLNAIAVIGCHTPVCTVILLARPLGVDECRFSTFQLCPGPLKLNSRLTIPAVADRSPS